MSCPPRLDWSAKYWRASGLPAVRFRAKFLILAFYPFSIRCSFRNGKLGKSGTVDCLYLNPDNNPWMCMCSSPSSHISFHHLNLSDSEPPCGWSDGFTGEIKCRKTYAKHPNFYGNNLHIFMSKNQKNTASIFKKSLDEFLVRSWCQRSP